MARQQEKRRIRIRLKKNDLVEVISGRDAGKRGLRCIRVVHGKGLGSKGRQPVLKGKTKVWLAQREDVIAFCQARATEGGGGALIVLLKPSNGKTL